METYLVSGAILEWNAVVDVAEDKMVCDPERHTKDKDGDNGADDDLPGRDTERGPNSPEDSWCLLKHNGWPGMRRWAILYVQRNHLVGTD